MALFRRSGARRRLSEDVCLADAMDGISHTSIDSGNSHEFPHVQGANDTHDSRSKYSSYFYQFLQITNYEDKFIPKYFSTLYT